MILLYLLSVVLKEWVPSQYQQHHLGACYKCRCGAPTTDLLKEKIGGLGPSELL